MATEVSETANAFAETACKLLAEYTDRLVKQKHDVLKILDQLHRLDLSDVDEEYLRKRYLNEEREYMGARNVFEKLSRKASQWVEHGKLPQPNLELELEVRLADFEYRMRSMLEFFRSNRV